MTQVFKYRSPATPGAAGWTVDLGNTAVRLGNEKGFVQEAELGAVGIGSLAIDDPTGTAGHSGDAIVGLKQLDVIELAATSGNRRVFTGYIADRRYLRGTEGNSPSLRTGAARIIDMTLVDINSFLSFRVFTDTITDETSSFNRPAETDVARVTALLAVDFISTTLFDGLVSTSNPVDMDAVDYKGQRPADVLNDCAQQSGKNYFVFYDEAGTYTPSAGDFGLFYDLNDSLVYPATTDFSVSNVLADVDFTAHRQVGPTWAPSIDGVLTRDPSRVIAGAYFENGSNSVYVTNPTTSYTFGWRDAVGNSQNLKTAAQARARSERYLNENATEDDRITFALKLPAANVNDCLPGQYFQAKFSHLPGYETFTDVRCLNRMVAQDELTDEFYNVRYEVTPLNIVTEPQGAFAQWSNSVSGSGIPILPSNTTPGNVLLLLVACAGSSASTTLAAARCWDNPNLGSPPVGPYADQAGWTQLDTVDTSALGQNILGPGAGFARSVTILWRYVAVGEVTDHPVAVSGPSAPGAASAWLYELPTTTAPLAGGTFETTVGTPPNVPHNYSLPSTPGNAIGMLMWEFADTGSETATVTVVAGTQVSSTQANNDTTSSVIGTGWAAPWVWIGQKSAGGVMTVNMATIPAYTNLAACGVTCTLPNGITLPNIPYPANQT